MARQHSSKQRRAYLTNRAALAAQGVHWVDDGVGGLTVELAGPPDAVWEDDGVGGLQVVASSGAPLSMVKVGDQITIEG